MNHEVSQATNMAKLAGIELNPEQIDSYTYARTSLDPVFNSKSDQVLLDLTLDENQTIKFRQFYRNMF